MIRTVKPKLTLFKAALLDAIRQYVELDFSLTRLELQKIAYFLNESWPGYMLDYAAGKYGPFSTKLEHDLHDMDGHWLIGCGDNADPRTEIELSDTALDAVEQFMAKYDPEMPYIKSKNRALEVMRGFETPFGMELLSTTHWLAAHGTPPATTIDEAFTMIQNWNQHKKELFERAHVACAWKRLEDQGWIIR
ncbi:MAG: hypothetical protein J6E31_07400 [Pyramidobacter sp.]|nr:hypothetical protein [Pyramidobacter sp.]